MASHALNPGKVSAFYDVQSDMGRLSHGLFRKTIAARWPELDILAKSPECRKMLLDLVDQNIKRLNEKIEEYKADSDARAEQEVTRLKFDPSPIAKQMREHHFKCSNAFHRDFERFKKYEKSGKAERERIASRVDERLPRVPDPRPRIADYQEWAPAAPASDKHSGGSFASQADQREADQRDAFAVRERQPEADNQTSEAKLSENMITSQNEERERIAVNSAVASPLDSRGAKPAEADRRSQQDSNGSSAVAADHRGHREPSPEPVAHPRREQAPNRENQTSEPKVLENVIIAKNQDPVRVAPNSVVAPGLDKLGPAPDEAKGAGRSPMGLLLEPSPVEVELLPPKLRGRYERTAGARRRHRRFRKVDLRRRDR